MTQQDGKAFHRPGINNFIYFIFHLKCIENIIFHNIIMTKFDHLIQVYIFSIINEIEIRIFEYKFNWEFLIVSKGEKNANKESI